VPLNVGRPASGQVGDSREGTDGEVDVAGVGASGAGVGNGHLNLLAIVDVGDKGSTTAGFTNEFRTEGSDIV
jgi:hypothetical protein